MKKIKDILLQVLFKLINRKYFYLTIISLLLCQNTHAVESDSVTVYLCKTDSAYYVDLVFENISSDSILIPAKFKNFYSNIGIGTGILINTYKDKKLFSINTGDMQAYQYFVFREQRFIYIPPRSEIKFNIDLLMYLPTIDSNAEFGVDLGVNFGYLLKKNQKGIPTFIRTKTNYIILNDWKIDKYK